MGKCGICGMEESPNNPLIEGLDFSICHNCFLSAEEVFAEKSIQNSAGEHYLNLVKPKTIKAQLDEYVIGQENAKIVLSAAIYNHYKRALLKSPIDIQKTNILMIGPSGCGKTYIIQQIAKIINVPLVIVDATSFTEAGYAGEDVESILKKLYYAADSDISRAEKGIVYIDEVDKLLSKSSHGERDVNGTGVQQALLKIIESSVVSVPLKNEGDGNREIQINTKDILFICGGAFVGMDKIIEKRIKNGGKVGKIGFQSEEAEDTIIQPKEVTTEDIISYGFIPELVGRLPIVVELQKLTAEDLKNVFMQPKNAIFKQYKHMFKTDGIELKISDDAINYIVDNALKKATGARGLRNVSEKHIYQLIYDSVDSDIKKITISKEMLMDSPSKAFEYVAKTKKESV